MPLYDLPLDEVRARTSEVREPDDVDAFWADTVAQARAHDLALVTEPVDAGLRLVETHDVTFAGFGGHPVRAWYTRPAGVDEQLPAIVEFRGYGGGRGLPHEHLVWASAGYAHLVMDTRGQGSAWGAGGHTADPGGSGPAVPGFLTRGIESPQNHYFRRLYTDGVRAVDAVRALPGVDPGRVAVTGISQGGAITLAVAGLADVAAAMVDVPFLCEIPRAIRITDSDPYSELVRYLSVHRDAVGMVERTLAYLDGTVLAARASAPVLFSVALMDPICPPSTVYAAYNRYGELAAQAGTAPMKEIVEYPFNQHEGGDAHHTVRQIAFLERVLRA